MKDISNELSINIYVHCGKCFEQLPQGESPASFAKLSVGFTKQGLQVWCDRHKVNVMHIDFEGKQHPANTTAMIKEEQ